jgi:hypothetical protein
LVRYTPDHCRQKPAPCSINWSSLVVLRKTGKITITVADLKGAYLIFGQCKAATPGG